MNTSDKKDNPEKDLQMIQEKIRSYILSNLLSVLSVTSLLVGGIIFWLYFSDIQYFPDLDFNESVLFLLVAAITGVTTILITALLIMTPYFCRWLFLLEQQNDNPLSSEEEKEKEVFSKIERFWYFSSIFIFYFVAFFLHFLLNFYFKTEDAYTYVWSIGAFITFLIFSGHYYIYNKGICWKSVEVFKWELVTGEAKESMFMAWLFSIFITLMVLIILIVPIVVKMDLNENVLFVIFLIIILGSNLLFAFFREKQEKTRWYWIIPILTVFFVFSIAKNTPIPKFVMNKYKFGNFEVQQLLVDAEGCKILKNLRLISDNSQNKTTCSLTNIKILSRLGHSFYIETICKPPLPCRQPLLFTIPSKHVLSWSIIPPQKNKADD